VPAISDSVSKGSGLNRKSLFMALPPAIG
jgi:hypothetical protein